MSRLKLIIFTFILSFSTQPFAVDIPTSPRAESSIALVVSALASGQPFVRVHSFPFMLDDKALSQHRENQWHPFWINLKEGYDYFNKYKRPPNVEVSNGKYTFGASSGK